jgi:hypothetical protein
VERQASSLRSELGKLRESKHIEDNNVKIGKDRLKLAETSATRESEQLAETVAALKRLTDKLSVAQQRCLIAEQEKVSGNMVVLQERVKTIWIVRYYYYYYYYFN